MSAEQPMRIDTSSGGKRMHFSAGVIVTAPTGHILLLDRMHPPLGWACPAGHVDEGESPAQAAIRELSEETGVVVPEAKLLWEEEVDGNKCRTCDVHYWYVYAAKTDQTAFMANQRETRGMGWFKPSEVMSLSLEPVWRRWLVEKKLLDLALA